MPSLGYITFTSDSPRLEFTCLLGDGSPTSTGGYGGWEIVSRPRRRGLTEWKGNEPLSMDVPILFDDFANGKSVEADILKLENMAGWTLREPPVINFDSGGVVPHDEHENWVISALAWGDADRNVVGNRVRQACTVTLLQYVEDDALEDISSAARRRARRTTKRPKNAGSKTYVVKTAETLELIAAKTLGKSSRWHELLKLNPKIRSPKKKLQPGTIIKLP